MAGSRMPLEVLEAVGAKHLSKSERAVRAAGEIHNSEPVKRLTPPSWLPPGQRKEFNRVSAALIKLMPTMVTRTDADVIATYCVARAGYLSATVRVNSGLKEGNLDAAKDWGLVQKRYFDQARACANDLGLTITSRCRLVVPEGARNPEESPFEKLMREKRGRVERA